jgi:hypothetical protein
MKSGAGKPPKRKEIMSEHEYLPHKKTITANPLVLSFEEEDRGKRVYYAARWVHATEQPGPWSDIESAIIP